MRRSSGSVGLVGKVLALGLASTLPLYVNSCRNPFEYQTQGTGVTIGGDSGSHDNPTEEDGGPDFPEVHGKGHYSYSYSDWNTSPSPVYNPDYRDEEDVTMSTADLVTKYDSGHTVYRKTSSGLINIAWDNTETAPTGDSHTTIRFYELMYGNFLDSNDAHVVKNINPTNEPTFELDLSNGVYVLAVRSDYVTANLTNGSIEEGKSEVHSSTEFTAEPSNGWFIVDGDPISLGLPRLDSNWALSDIESTVQDFRDGNITKGIFSLYSTIHSREVEDI